MLLIDWDPNLFTIGPFTAAWHGLLTGLSVLVGVLITVSLTKRKGFSEELVYGVALVAIPGGIIGARLFHVLDHAEYYLANPGEAFIPSGGLAFFGLSFYGAVVGGMVAGIAYARFKKIAVFPFLDAVAPAILVAHIIGRVGCLINGDAYGSATDLPWGIVYTNPGAFAPLNVASHPFPIYEIVLNLAILGILWRLWKRELPDGMIFLTYASIYAVGRFFLTFVRDDPVIFMGLREAHLISIAWLIIAIPLMIYLNRRQQQLRTMSRVQRRRQHSA
jgi:phosphatidylglycerol:prolipoprotein diacylglycerol transferase